MTTDISIGLVRRLVAAQFPHWADLPIAPVVLSGWDNRTFRLGETMAVRLPSAAGYVAQVDKEQHWLPRLAPQLPLPIPTPLARGTPSADYPWPWSIYRWLPGTPAAIASSIDLPQVAVSLAQFLRALQQIDPAGGPPPGAHNFYRGGSLSVYDAETRAAIVALADQIDPQAATALWEAALGAAWNGPPVWLHGDVAPGNLLIADGTLCAVLDFGCMGVGDPACDLTIAWTLFAGPSRTAFRQALPLDAGTWARGRGWSLWKALIMLAAQPEATAAAAAHGVIAAVLRAHQDDAAS